MNSLFFFFLGMLIIVGCLSVSVYQHERVHQEVFKEGGVESDIVLSLTTGQVLTVPREGEVFNSKEDALVAGLSNNFNEAVAYNLTPMFIMLGVINILGFMYLGEKK